MHTDVIGSSPDEQVMITELMEIANHIFIHHDTVMEME